MLIINDHKFYIISEININCLNHKIVFLCFSSHSTDLFQFLNVEISDSFSDSYKKNSKNAFTWLKSITTSFFFDLKIIQSIKHKKITRFNIMFAWIASDLTSLDSNVIYEKLFKQQIQIIDESLLIFKNRIRCR